MKQATFDGWVSVYETGVDYEAEMVRDRLVDSGLSAVIMTKKDRAFGLSVGAMSRIYVLVTPEEEAQALNLLQDHAFTSSELTQAALDADPETVEEPEKRTEES